MQRKWERQELMSIDRMSDADYRNSVFASVFNNEQGKLVLDWLDKIYKITNPDTANPNDVYYRLGKQGAITHIRNILSQAKEAK